VTRSETPTNRRVHQRDVAERAGVSPSTVSLVLAGKHAAIPLSTQQRVLAAAAELGYRPNALAASLRRQTTDTIGFVSDLIATTPHAGAMVQGAQDAAWKAGKVLLMINTGGDSVVELRAIEVMLERRVEGVIYATMYHQLIDPPALLLEAPAVLLDARSASPALSSVAPDEEGGAFAAVSCLLDAGHRRIAYLQSDASVPAAEERLRGYRAALGSRGIPFDTGLVRAALDEHQGGFEAASAVLALRDRPTAIFCFNDRMAAGAARASRRLGFSIPAQLSLVGFDNEELVAPLIEPPLTTVQLPHYEMGFWAMEHLLAQVADPASTRPEQFRMPCPLVPRASVAAPRDR
jgi:LacI family transcriptional regulator